MIVRGVVNLLLACLFFLASNVYAHKVISFNQALTIAYRNNPQLRAQNQKANEAKGVFIQNSQLLNPSILLEGENIAGSGAYKGLESAETTLSLAQPIPLGGKRYYLKQSSLADYQSLLASIDSKRSDIYIAVGHAYVDVLYANKWHVVTKKLTALNQQIVTDISKRKKSGASAEVDLHLAKIRLGEAKIQQQRTSMKILEARARLSQELGETKFLFEVSDEGLPHKALSWSQIESRINTSAFIREKKCQLNASRKKIVAVKKDVWPTVSLQFGARHFSDDNENALVISASSKLPLFDKNQGKIVSAESYYSRILEEIKITQLLLQQKLYTNYLNEQQNNNEAMTVKKHLLPLAKQAAKLASIGYQRGLYSYGELSNAMRTLFNEEQHFQDAHAKRDKALITINGLLR